MVDGGTLFPFPEHGIVSIKHGQRLQTRPPGGGGIGNPFDREIEAVQADVRNGLVSWQAARKEYGVAIDPIGFEVDPVETARLRSEGLGPTEVE